MGKEMGLTQFRISLSKMHYKKFLWMPKFYLQLRMHMCKKGKSGEDAFVKVRDLAKR